MNATVPERTMSCCVNRPSSLRRIWLVLTAAALLGAGCGDDDVGGSDAGRDAGAGSDAQSDAQGPDGAALGSVTISAIEHRVTMTGAMDVPGSGLTIQVTGSDGAGGTITREGTLGPDGRVTITGVPSGELLYSARAYAPGGSVRALDGTFTTERSLDIGADTKGGYGTGFTSNGTRLAFTLTGLTAWTNAHTLRMLVPTHASTSTSLGASSPTGITGFPTTGATSLSGLSFPWGRQFPDPTDQIVLVQRETVLQAGLTVSRIIKSFALPVPTTLADGVPTTFTGALTDAPVVAVPVRVDGAAWSAQVPKIAPGAVNSTLQLRYFGGPAPLDRNTELASVSMSGTAGSVDTTVNIGDPFTGGRIVTVVKVAAKSVTAPGATTSQSLPYATIGAIYDLAALPTTALVPLLSPAEAPQIAGRDARQPQTSVGLTPMVSWSPPMLGTATRYEVYIYELLNNAGATDTAVALHVNTAGTSFRVPPDVLLSGKSYFMSIHAHSFGSVSAPERTYRSLPVGQSTSISAVFTP